MINEFSLIIKYFFEINRVIQYILWFLNKKSNANNNEEINKNIKEYEYNNNSILKEINEKQKIINAQNKEKDELFRQIKILRNKKNNIK